VTLSYAPLQGASGSRDLLALVAALLAELSEEHGPPIAREEVGDPNRDTVEVEAQLVETIAKVAAVWHAELGALVGKAVDIERSDRKRPSRE
jgi:hypothetical protein